MQLVNALAAKHFQWVERMGWHNKTDLESLALITSEVGETFDEILDDEELSPAFGEELADIILRTLDLAHLHGLDLDASALKLGQPAMRGEPARTGLARLVPEIARAVNACRGAEPAEPFGPALTRIVQIVFALAQWHGVDLLGEIERKMDKNERNGTRGRLI